MDSAEETDSMSLESELQRETTERRRRGARMEWR